MSGTAPGRWRHDRLPTLLGLLLLLAAWELAGRGAWVAGGALPAPSQIGVQAWADRADYPAHLLGTLRTAALGFVIGNAVAIAFGLLFVMWRPAERLMAGVNVTVFAMPAIALVPILVIALPGDAARVVLAAVSVYYPTMVAVVLGLRQADPRLCDLVRTYGGGEWTILWRVRLRGGLPTLLSGLRVAAPAAVLGSLLAEFGSGASAGLGTYLIGSLGRADPARLWGIGLAATAISALAYGAVSLAATRFAGDTVSASTPLGLGDGATAREPRGRRVTIAVAAAALPLALWWACTVAFEAMGVSEVVFRTPAGVLEHLLWAEEAGENMSRLVGALVQTLPLAVLGLLAGLAFALVLAIVATVWPPLGATLLPVSLVTQSMPLVALTPLVVLVVGRDAAAILAITVSVTFFPAYVTIAQGLALVPASVRDLVRAYGGGPGAWLRRVAIPWSAPHLCAAMRLAAPRAVLGAMIAEWLATGTGLGNLLNEARGMLDYGTVWSVAVASVLAAIGLHALAAAIERRVLARFASGGGG
ncbi:MAG: ABC transporter permease subunit [Burkholderiales bacterium]|nr:ABC transporter permease subunit [Burkholderiales bacterium]